jgi:hypothetical protein
LEGLLGGAVELLAYPNGDCTPDIAQQARAAGYRVACTTHSALVSPADDRLRLPRLEADWTSPRDVAHLERRLFP